MKNNRQKTTHPEKTDLKKIAGLQKLQLEQLDDLAGGPVSGDDRRGGHQAVLVSKDESVSFLPPSKADHKSTSARC